MRNKALDNFKNSMVAVMPGKHTKTMTMERVNPDYNI